MHVIATAGHVDHGKSTLVEALTGRNPDRLDEERRRGLTIELGYAWTTIEDAGEIAFVDVPGHERFVSTMLTGAGPVPGVLFVVAADDPWMPQAGEHLAALDAFGVRHGILAVTRCDLAEPGPSRDRALAEIAKTSLGVVPAVCVSGRTGTGIPELRRALATLTAELPTPDPDAPARLWIDRRFQLAGAGTVVTGTLCEGSIGVGDRLECAGALIRVRGIQMLERGTTGASAVARVALRLGRLTGRADELVRRGRALVAPDAWVQSTTLDLRVPGSETLPEQPVLYLGSSSQAGRVRRLDDELVSVRLAEPIAVHVGDRIVLRDPGRRLFWGGIVLDPMPPVRRGRAAARHRASELAVSVGVPDLADELRRRTFVARTDLRRLGVDVVDGDRWVGAADWLMSQGHAAELRERLRAALETYDREHPTGRGMSVADAARLLGLPVIELVASVVPEPYVAVHGHLTDPGRQVPAWLVARVNTLLDDLAKDPFCSPDTDRLAALGLDHDARRLAAERGLVLLIPPDIVLAPDAEEAAAQALGSLPQPFTVSQARDRLRSTRRVVVPLLERLDERGITKRNDKGLRRLANPVV